jgi:enoyl-CoA hydratase
MSYSNILFDIDGEGIAVVTANRPDKLNALNSGMVCEIEDVVGRMEREAACKALIVTGAGEKAFIAGADIGELSALKPAEARAYAIRGQRVFRQIERLPKPSVAAINGFALGGGLELAMACTVRLASPNAKLGQPETKLGIIPGYGGTQRLPRLLGRGRALELLLSGDPVDAAEAYRIGLVNRVVEREQLLEEARAWLRKVLANGPVAVGLTLEAVDVGLNCGVDEGLRFEAAAFGVASATEDRIEGTRAFLEKRRPAFTGR